MAHTEPLRIQRRRPARNVSVSVSVSASVVQGNVTQADLEVWVTQAIAHYHNFRGGHVGLAIVGGIAPPDVTVLEDV